MTWLDVANSWDGVALVI